MKIRYSITKTFGVEATNLQGKPIRLTLNAPSEDLARQHVEQRGLSPVYIYELPRSSRNALKIYSTSQGVQISLPSRRDLQTEQARINSFIGWSFVGIFALALLFSNVQGRLRILLGTIIGIIWGVGELEVTYRLANAVMGREKLNMSLDKIKIGRYLLGIGRTTAYTIEHITNIRVAPQGNELLFDYNGHTIRFGKNLYVEEANMLCKHLVDILTFHCQSVRRVLFGTLPSGEHAPFLILSNPDVSELEFPFVHLTQIVIEADSYNFHQVERFLTYAVNVIGQEHLKRHVDVHLYGDEQRLHPNLRNSFINLCKCFHVHKQDDILVPISV